MLLTIAIPAYGRPETLRFALDQFIKQIDGKFDHDVQIIVTDDATPNDALAFVKELAAKHQFITYRRHAQNMGLEKNLIAATEGATGEYLWIFGDDDYLELDDALQRIIHRLRTTQFDMLVLNRTRRSADLSELLSDNWMSIDGADRDYSGLREFCLEFGFISIVGFVSVNIFKRTAFQRVDLSKYFGTMYPQLGAMMEAFHDRPVSLATTPLVCQRTQTPKEKKAALANKTTESDFMTDVKQRNALYFSHPFIAMLRELVARNAFLPADIVQIRENTVITGFLVQFLLESLQRSLQYTDRFDDEDWRLSTEFLSNLPLNSVQREFLNSISERRSNSKLDSPTKDRASMPPTKQRNTRKKVATISVITPSFNQGDFLAECLDSVRQQSAKPIEHFVYDPGSTDASRDIATQFEHVTLFAEPDTGQSDALNKGFKRAKGDIIAWLNSDDMFTHRKVFKKVISRFNRWDAPDIVYGKGSFIDETGNSLREVYVNKDPSTLHWRFQQEDGILQPALFMRRSVVEKIGELVGTLHYSMDYQYWIRCVKAGLKFAYIDEDLALARYHRANKTYGQRGESYAEVCRMMMEQFGYVNHVWLRRYAEFLSEGFDGVLATARNKQVTDVKRLDDIYQTLLFEHNSSPATIALLQQNASKSGYGDTLREIRQLGILHPKASKSDISASRNGASGRPHNTDADTNASNQETHTRSFAIVTPNFNCAPYIEETVKSILEQNHPNLEYVVVDGASKDGSQAIIERYLPQLTDYISEPDSGHAEAINKGFSRTSGEIMGWINSDDILLPGALEAVEAVFNQHPEIDWIMGRPSTVSDEAIAPRIHPLRKFSRLRFLCGHYMWIQQESTFWRRSLWDRAGGKLDENVKLATDFELWLRFFRSAELFSVDLPLGAFRVREGQRSIVFRQDYETEAQNLLLKESQSLEPGFCSTFEMMLPKEPKPLSKDEITKAEKQLSICDTPTITIDDTEIKSETTNDRTPTMLSAKGRASDWRKTLSVPDDLLQFKDTHKNQRCFIMGNGPSLNKMNLDNLEGEIVFGCNSIFLLFDKIKWRPKYYASVDSRVLPDRAQDIDQMLDENPDMMAFFPSELQEHTGLRRRFPTKTIIPPGANRAYFNEVRNSLDNAPYSMFSNDIDDYVVQPFTVVITMLQIANYMGFSDIYLIGCDTNYTVPDDVKKEGLTASGKVGLALTSTKDNDPNHFDPSYFGKGRKWHDPQTEMMIEHYRHAKVVFDEHGNRVFNATVGGKLEVFPRVEYQSLFSDPRGRAPESIIEGPASTQSTEALEAKRASIVSKLPSNIRYPIFLPTESIALESQIEGLKKVAHLYETELDASHRPRLRALKAMRRSSRCFVIGNGPSLKKTDLSKLKNEATFATNGFFLKLPDLDWTPTYYVVEDHLVAEDRAQEINSLHGPTKLFPANLRYALEPDPDTIFYDHRPRISFPHGFDFSFDADVNTYAGGTVTFSCLQLAAFLGYEEIYLIGVDADYAIPADATLSGGSTVKEIDMKSDDPNHFHPDYFGKGKRWHEPNVHVMLAAYEEAKCACDARGVKIMNATVGGKLEVFPRVDFDSIPPEIHPIPRLLLIDHTRIGDATATGELKASLFREWPSERLMQIFDADYGRIGVTGAGASLAINSKSRNAAKEIEKQIKAFKPDAILYRPAPVLNTEPLHATAMNIIANSELPLVTWIMDDWPTTQTTSGYTAFDKLEADWRSLAQRAVLRLSIGEKMSGAFSARYSTPFTPFANGVAPEDWPEVTRRTAKGPIRVRYAGSLAENMTLYSVRLIAEAVESLAADGIDIIFEIRTRELWRKIAAPHLEAFSHTQFIPADTDLQEYRDWLSGADIVVIAYNFDDASTNYVRYSVANKLPECLACGAALVAVGPADVATMTLLEKLDCGMRIVENDLAAVKTSLAELAASPDNRYALAGKAQQTAFEEFDIGKISTNFTTSIAKAVAQRHAGIVDHFREKHARLDETAAVAFLLAKRKGRKHVMLDVGAHVGSSADYFHELGWTIHCFEPDPDNREKLVTRFGKSSNVTIDSRAVSDTSAHGVSFFSSAESTGISGLHAFHNTHRETGLVDVTTVAEIVVAHGLKHVDFLKIDVEGFDFSVIKGVPWEELMPDVVECEFEDAKTASMGHTWRDIAEFLRQKGYAVYLSEWHPIIRYGVPHDWRRIVPFPGCDMANDAWGNILAFREDPGYKAVNSAFATVLKTHLPKRAQQPSASVNVMMATEASSTYVRVAHAVRRRSPRLFALLRFAKRSVDHILRRGMWTLPMFLAFGGAAAMGLHPAFADYRFVIWNIVALTALMFGVAYTAFRTYSVAERLTAEKHALQRKINTVTAALAEEKRQSDGYRRQAAVLAQQGADEAKKLAETLSETEKRLAETLSETEKRLAETLSEIDKRSAQSATRISVALTTLREDFTQELAEQNEQISNRLADIDQALKKMPENASWYQHFNRQLKQEHIETIEKEWSRRLSVNISGPELGYMASRACQVESMLSGRLAASIEDIVLRTIVAKSVKNRNVEILEIGTLFGAGAGIMYDALATQFDAIHLTLLDPLDGYYSSEQKDILTGQPVNEKALLQNLKRIGLTQENFTLIKKLSTEVEAIEAASAREYDVLVIDGDHSYAGVKADFDNYAPMVRLGGYIVIDDYGSKDWPDVTRFVDSELKHADFVTPVGVSWRTCVYRVVKPQDSA